ncbi:MAG TPA: PEP-CTERM sorting domain-containing protein [Pirellulales bacterium]|jgi:hypothetical protein|nr:PEP-CTERM sorting domain-containing protein [Pirellulales bacterium]
MFRQPRFFLSLITAFSLLLGAEQARAALIIDPLVIQQVGNFPAVFPRVDLVNAGAGTVSEGTANPSGLGNTRNVSITSPIGSKYFATADVNLSDPTSFTFTTPNSPGPTGTNTATADLIYDGSTTATPSTINPIGLAAFNATSGGNNGIGFTASTSSSFGMDITITAYQSTINLQAPQTATIHVPSGSSPTPFFVLFSSFTGGGTDFSNLGALDIHFAFTNNVGGTGQISALKFDTNIPAPEPASLALFGTAGLCLAGFGYRRSRRQTS